MFWRTIGTWWVAWAVFSLVFDFLLKDEKITLDVYFRHIFSQANRCLLKPRCLFECRGDGLDWVLASASSPKKEITVWFWLGSFLQHCCIFFMRLNCTVGGRGLIPFRIVIKAMSLYVFLSCPFQRDQKRSSGCNCIQEIKGIAYCTVPVKLVYIFLQQCQSLRNCALLRIGALKLIF